MKVRIPGRVWYEALDPNASGMEDALGLKEERTVNSGRGFSVIYEVDDDTAHELASYLIDHGRTLLGQGVDYPDDPDEKAMRDALRACIKTGQKIRADLKAAA